MNSPPKQIESASPREVLLNEARKVVTQDRNNTYGNPEDSFNDIANLWSAYKGVKFSPMDVVVMNALIKVARLKANPGYRDGLVDIAGYAACGADIQAGMMNKTQAGALNIASQQYDPDRNIQSPTFYGSSALRADPVPGYSK